MKTDSGWYKDRHTHLSGQVLPGELLEWAMAFDHFDMSPSDCKLFLHSTESLSGGGLKKYLNVVHQIDKLQTSEMIIKLCVFRACMNHYMAGGRFLEIRWNPLKRASSDSHCVSLMRAAKDAATKASQILGIHVSFCICLGREISYDSNVRLFEICEAASFKELQITAIDIAGPYLKDFDYSDYEDIYSEARHLGLDTTVHCCEERHDFLSQELEAVVSYLNPNRIGHGIQARLLPYSYSLVNNRCLEVCISSNLASGALRNFGECVDFARWAKSGVVEVQVCTDATATLSTNIRREHLLWNSILEEDLVAFNRITANDQSDSSHSRTETES